MLSVLIPTYNYNASFLVEEMHQQLTLENIIFEIICLDDGSNSSLNNKNEKINKFSFSSFKSLEHNIGRSAIRNLLAKKASYTWLLFLDADVLPANATFIKKYIACIKEEKTVFCGGILYQNKKENFNLLRYKYGKKHEEIPLEKRIKNAKKYFFTSNFLIEKVIFESVLFEEKLTQYGREDLLFSLDLIKKKFTIKHLSNEVYHLGLDKNTLFVSKTKKAMENLVFIEDNEFITEKELPILKLVGKFSKIKMTRIVSKLYPYFEKLSINNSSVFFLNCLKVSYLCHLKARHE
ncbi:glycosyltransferase family 2 protein [Polaribacter sp. IC073]|uniref:glycosyltransferase family 2 protein n=1 Tax=Polaribacter sp. IC073 TaxID=2508540 RepID=UPI0011BD8434|nr:glycosyltransferase [Polaribacter sp. IC073]TXD46659.1 glycosyltransferase family 2 protein [Polaribacter sp. IC073]